MGQLCGSNEKPERDIPLQSTKRRKKSKSKDKAKDKGKGKSTKPAAPNPLFEQAETSRVPERKPPPGVTGHFGPTKFPSLKQVYPVENELIRFYCAGVRNYDDLYDKGEEFIKKGNILYKDTDWETQPGRVPSYVLEVTKAILNNILVKNREAFEHSCEEAMDAKKAPAAAGPSRPAVSAL